MMKAKQQSYTNHLIIVIALLLGFFIFAVLFCNAHFFKKLYESEEYPMWRQVMNIISKQQNDISLLVIGDSRAKAGFIPKKDTMLNLALGGSTPIEGYFTLKKFLDSGSTTKAMVVSYTPLHLMRQEVFWQRTVNYQYLNFDEYREVREKAKQIFTGRVYPFGPLGEVDKWWLYRALPGMHIPTWFSNLFRGSTDYHQVYSALEKSNGHFYFGKSPESSDINLEAGLKQFVVNPLFAYYLEQLFALAHENGIDIYWYTMPFNQSSCKKANKNFITQFKKNVKTFTADRATLIQGFSCWPDPLFGDADHLYNGAEKATKQIIKAVRQ